jgi:hypothetical protein
MAKKATQAKAATQVIDLTQGEQGVASREAASVRELQHEQALAAQVAEEQPVIGDGVMASTTAQGVQRTLTFTATTPGERGSTVFSHHGVELHVGNISHDGLLYLLTLGYTTSLTQVNAGEAKALRDEGIPEDEIKHRLRANMEERAGKIASGTIGSRVASATPKDADTKLLHTLAWAAIQRSNAKRGLADPKGSDKALAIARFLETPAGAAVRGQADAMAALDLD